MDQAHKLPMVQWNLPWGASRRLLLGHMISLQEESIYSLPTWLSFTRPVANAHKCRLRTASRGSRPMLAVGQIPKLYKSYIGQVAFKLMRIFAIFCQNPHSSLQRQLSSGCRLLNSWKQPVLSYTVLQHKKLLYFNYRLFGCDTRFFLELEILLKSINGFFRKTYYEHT